MPRLPAICRRRAEATLLRERKMPDAGYAPLRQFIRRHGGLRLSASGSLRDRLVTMAVEECPIDAPDEMGAEVLAARMRIRLRGQYGSVVALLAISVLANLIARLVWRWYVERHSHRVLMRGWQSRAQES